MFAELKNPSRSNIFISSSQFYLGTEVFPRLWLGVQGIPMVKKWEATGIDRELLVKIESYWHNLEAEFKPKANKILLIIELGTRCRQNLLYLSVYMCTT